MRIPQPSPTPFERVVCGTQALCFAGVTLTYRRQLMAGLLDLGPDALVSGRAALLGLDGFDEGDGNHVARVDFDFGPKPVIVEVGGRQGHLSFDERRRQEHRRNELQLLGKTIYFFCTEDVVEDRSYVLTTVRRGLAA